MEADPRAVMVSISLIVLRHILDKDTSNIFKEDLQHQIETDWDAPKFSHLSLLLESAQSTLLPYWILIIDTYSSKYTY